MLITLRPLEVEYRSRLMAVASTAARQAAVDSLMSTKNTNYMEAHAFNICGVPIAMRGANLAALVQIVAQALNLEIDVRAALSEINLDSWQRCQYDREACLTVGLTTPKLCAHECPRSLPGITPMVSLILDDPRIPDKEEWRGFEHQNRPVQMEVAVQAVDHRRLGGPLDTVVICIVRGVRLATGALEDALALVQQDVETRLAPTLALFGGATLLTEVRIHRVRKKPDPKKPLDKAWACATEAFFEVASTVSLALGQV